MTTTIAVSVAIEQCDLLVDKVDEGSTDLTGDIELWHLTGAAPAFGAAPTGTLLGSADLANPAFAAAIDANPNAFAALAGVPIVVNLSFLGGPLTINFARIRNRNNSAVFDGDVGLTGSGAMVEVDNVSGATGATVTITGGGHTQNESG